MSLIKLINEAVMLVIVTIGFTRLLSESSDVADHGG
jgi:hypothetical protein